MAAESVLEKRIKRMSHTSLQDTRSRSPLAKGGREFSALMIVWQVIRRLHKPAVWFENLAWGAEFEATRRIRKRSWNAKRGRNLRRSNGPRKGRDAGPAGRLLVESHAVDSFDLSSLSDSRAMNADVPGVGQW